ncbi:unnamed protein product [Rotaria sordida]|uniref:G-protein coupled receptors family 1 profile domain-containing protein n=1 Tax=Rotaria sordida TaxID=392033 RepID=A0A818N6M8_9BILA|nr:unnamed protein product [Rotaria sordida]
MCSVPCYLTTYWGVFDLLFNVIFPVCTIVIANLALIARVIYQKSIVVRRTRIDWRRQRKMTLQLGIISTLYLVIWLPVGIGLLGQIYISSTFFLDQIDIFSFLTYLVPLLLPFVCLISMPGLMKKLKAILFRRQIMAVAPKIDENYEQSIIIPVNYNSNQSFSPSLFDDNQLLPGQSRIDYKIHQGFTLNEEILIKNALEIIANRLFKPEILQNMYNICGTSGELLGARVWSRSQLGNDKNYHGMYDLLRFQLMCLKIKSENDQFPTIHIYPMYEKNETQAEGTVGCISCISHGSTFSIEGNFQVKLNRYNLDALNKNVENLVYWAGTIIHEMLHNLGHKHKNNDYSNQWQINIFENCFIYN